MDDNPTPSVWDISRTSRAEIAVKAYGAALAGVHKSEHELELRLDALERAHRDVVREARFEPVPELSRMAMTGWNERRVRLLAEKERAA